jgi:hypothetical protein
MAVWINSNASDDEILEVVFEWVDALSRRDYERVARELGYWDFDVGAATRAIREAIEGYRAPALFPDIENFVVSDWRLATGGNPEPKREVVWYKENAVGIVVSIKVHLPLNGAWSDLTADLLLFERGGHPGKYELRLEEITHPVRGLGAEGSHE